MTGSMIRAAQSLHQTQGGSSCSLRVRLRVARKPHVRFDEGRLARPGPDQSPTLLCLGPPKRTRTIGPESKRSTPSKLWGPVPANLYGGVGPAVACFRSWSAGGTAANGALRWRTMWPSFDCGGTSLIRPRSEFESRRAVSAAVGLRRCRPRLNTARGGEMRLDTCRASPQVVAAGGMASSGAREPCRGPREQSSNNVQRGRPNLLQPGHLNTDRGAWVSHLVPWEGRGKGLGKAGLKWLSRWVSGPGGATIGP